MRRGAILVVPIQMFKKGDIELPSIGTGVFGGYWQKLLADLGVCRAAIQACNRCWEDPKTDALLFRFQTDEHGATMPEWQEWSVPSNVWYDLNGFGEPGWRATMLNAYFPAEPSEPDKAVVSPRRWASLEG